MKEIKSDGISFKESMVFQAWRKEKKKAKIENGEQEPHSTSESKENNSSHWKDFQESGTLTSDRFNNEE